MKKPGTGIPPARLGDVVGRRLRRSVAIDEQIGLERTSNEAEDLRVVSARPSYSRIKSALRAINEHPDLELQLVVAASALLERYGNAIQAIERDGFDHRAARLHGARGREPRDVREVHRPRAVELATVFDNLKPDAVVTIADRYETLATAVAASYMNIPVAHVQGGEVTGSIDEKVRHAVTKLANLHLVSTDKARERVIRLGEEPATVV